MAVSWASLITKMILQKRVILDRLVLLIGNNAGDLETRYQYYVVLCVYFLKLALDQSVSLYVTNVTHTVSSQSPCLSAAPIISFPRPLPLAPTKNTEAEFQSLLGWAPAAIIVTSHDSSQNPCYEQEV